MARTFLTDLNLNKNSLNNARIQNLASDPSTPVIGQTYFNTGSNKLRTYNGTTWDEYGTSTATGDVSQAANSGGAGRIKVSAGANKVITDYATAGIVKSDASGVASAAVAGTDYTSPSGTETLANKTLNNTNVVTVKAGNLTVQDDTDATKQAKFVASGIATATTRSFTLPDATTTLVGIDTTQTLTNKTIGGGQISGNITGNAANVTGTVAVANGGTGATTLTGILKGNGTAALTAATAGTDYVTGSSTNTFTNKTFDANATGNAISNLETADLAAGVLNTSASLASATDTQLPSALAVKTYADNIASGVKWKDSVRAATTTNGALATAYANASVIDGVTLATGDRILIKDQTTGSENGIYTVNATGAPTRATDADSASELKQATTFVQEGTANADSQWVLTNDGTITVGTTALVFALAGNNSIASASTTVQGKVELATQAEAQGKTDATRALTAASVADFARKYTGTIGDGVATAIAVTHGLGSQYVTAQVFDATSNVMVECDVTLSSATQTTFTFNAAPTANQYRVVITG